MLWRLACAVEMRREGLLHSIAINVFSVLLGHSDSYVSASLYLPMHIRISWSRREEATSFKPGVLKFLKHDRAYFLWRYTYTPSVSTIHEHQFYSIGWDEDAVCSTFCRSMEDLAVGLLILATMRNIRSKQSIRILRSLTFGTFKR